MNGQNAIKKLNISWLVSIIVVAVMFTLTTSAYAGPKELAKERSVYYKLINERQVIRQRLSQLDRRAAQLMQQGQDPVVLHAEQVGLQDKLDLIELRLEIVAARLGFDVPPAEAVDENINTPSDDPVRDKAYKAFERGRERTMTRLRKDAKRLLSTINFTRFLAKPVINDLDNG